MATRMYEANFKQWDHSGNVVPEVEHSESQYPSAELKPAAWLPVQRYDKKNESYAVINAGKVIAVDREGRVVPAGLRKAFEVGGGTTVLTYTATDSTEGVIDLATGSTVAAAGSTYTQAQLTAALKTRNLIRSTEYACDFISRPVGYAPYSFWKWCGGDGYNPAQFVQHNYCLQTQVAAGCDKVLQIPHLPAVETAEVMGDGGAISDIAIVFGGGGPSAVAWKSATGIHATLKYASLVAATDNVIAYVFGEYPVAKNISWTTPITDSASNLASMTEVNSIADVIAGGSSYYYIDYEAGVMFLYEAGGNAVPAAWTNGATTITYYSYENVATGSANYATVIGDINVGDFVTFNATSDYIKWVPDIGTCSGNAGDVYAGDPDYPGGVAATISAQLEAFTRDSVMQVIGQVVAVWTWPRSALDKVATQYTQLSVMERMPGTATLGMTDALSQSGSANKMVIINFCAR